MNVLGPKMASSAEAFLLVAALFSANAAWCQSDKPPVALEGLYEFEAVSISKAGLVDAVIAGVQMALAREVVWPSYGYEINPDSNDLSSACQFVGQLDHGAAFLAGQVKLDAQNSGDMVMGIGLRPSKLCESGNIHESKIVWPSYGYEINPDSDDLGSACQFVDQLDHGAAFLASQVKLDAQNSSGKVDGYVQEASSFCDSDSSAAGALEENTNYYFVTESPLPSREFNTLIWPEDAEWQGVANYFLRSGENTAYYLVTESPVPSLELSSRVYLDQFAVPESVRFFGQAASDLSRP